MSLILALITGLLSLLNLAVGYELDRITDLPNIIQIQKTKLRRYRLAINILTIFAAATLSFLTYFSQKKEAEHNRTIEVLMNETKGFVTGGDSVVFLELKEGDPNKFIGKFIVVGDYPVLDVNAFIDGGGRCDGLEPWNMLKSFAHGSQRQFQSGAISKDSFLLFPSLFEPSCDSVKYNIIFHTRTGSYWQEFRLEKIQDKWVGATQLLTLPDMKKRMDAIDPDFPKNINGEVDWYR